MEQLDTTKRLTEMKEFLVSALRIILLKTVKVEIMKEGVISVDHWIELAPIDDNRWSVAVWHFTPQTYSEPEDSDLVDVGEFHDTQAVKKIIELIIDIRLQNYLLYRSECES